MFRQFRCPSALSIVIGLGVGSIASASEPATSQTAEFESARLEVREVRRLTDELLGALEAELMTRIKSADPELAAKVQQNLMFQRRTVDWSWEALEALPPQFMPALAAQARQWRSSLELQVPRMHHGFDLATRMAGDAAFERAIPPRRSVDACNAAQTEDRICQVTPSQSCYQTDSLVCIDFCGALLGIPVSFKAIAGDETHIVVGGFGANFPSPFSIFSALYLHLAQIVCNLIECAVDVVEECTRNEIRELIEQQHRHINDFDLDAATQELLENLNTNKGNTLQRIVSTKALSTQLDARLAEEREFVDDSELFAAERDVSRDLFALREQLCTLESLLYRPVGDQDQVLSNCGTTPAAGASLSPMTDDQTARLVIALMKAGRVLPSLYLPESEGGLLEAVRALALNAARVGENSSNEALTQAERAMRQRRYKEAYLLYCRSVGGAS